MEERIMDQIHEEAMQIQTYLKTAELFVQVGQCGASACDKCFINNLDIECDDVDTISDSVIVELSKLYIKANKPNKPNKKVDAV